MLNKIWGFMIITGIIVSIFNGQVEEVSTAILTSSFKAVEISIGLLGPMVLWLGFMEILKEGGIMEAFQRLLKPLIAFLFPGVPPHHPASGAIILNLGASILGMGNAATPLGIKAMQELKRLNANQDTASNAMCTLLALNTSSITLFPAFVISLRMAVGSKNPMEIIVCTILATTCSTIGAVFMSRLIPILKRETDL